MKNGLIWYPNKHAVIYTIQRSSYNHIVVICCAHNSLETIYHLLV